MPVALVVAVAKNGVIGSGGDLPWRISDDLKWVKKVTLGKPVVMGRKTYQSIGKALPGRDNIVVTRTQDFSADGVFVTHALDDALTLAAACARKRGADEICIIGGGEIYAQMLGRADRIYLTRVEADIKGDAFFPDLDPAEWRERRESACPQNEKNQYACAFVVLERRAAQCESL